MARGLERLWWVEGAVANILIDLPDACKMLVRPIKLTQNNKSLSQITVAVATGYFVYKHSLFVAFQNKKQIF